LSSRSEVKAIFEPSLGGAVVNVRSDEQFVRGGSSSSSRAHSWKW
jgi:hypothetical protein